MRSMVQRRVTRRRNATPTASAARSAREDDGAAATPSARKATGRAAGMETVRVFDVYGLRNRIGACPRVHNCLVEGQPVTSTKEGTTPRNREKSASVADQLRVRSSLPGIAVKCVGLCGFQRNFTRQSPPTAAFADNALQMQLGPAHSSPA